MKEKKQTGPMIWVGNLIQYYDTKQAGICPQCKCGEIEVEEHTFAKRKSITFTCKNCDKWVHFDGSNE